MIVVGCVESGLCDEPIICSEESFRVCLRACMCVCSRDLKTRFP